MLSFNIVNQTPPITITDLEQEDYFDNRNYFNNELMKLFKPLDLAETYGSGIRRVKGLLKANNSPELEYSSKDHSSDKIKANEEYLRIRYGKNEGIGEVENGLSSKIKDDSTGNSTISAETTVELIGDKLSKIKKKDLIKIVEYLNEHQTIKAEEIVKLLDKAPSTIHEYLQILEKWEFLKSEGKTKDRLYIKNY